MVGRIALAKNADQDAAHRIGEPQALEEVDFVPVDHGKESKNTSRNK